MTEDYLPEISDGDLILAGVGFTATDSSIRKKGQSKWMLHESSSQDFPASL